MNRPSDRMSVHYLEQTAEAYKARLKSITLAGRVLLATITPQGEAEIAAAQRFAEMLNLKGEPR